LNSLERVLTTLSHKEPDRVPIGEWGIDHDHVSKIIGRHTYWRNRKDTTIALWEGRRDEAVESMKKDYVELIEELDYDVIPVEIVPPKGWIHPNPPRKVSEGLWEDSSGNIYKYAASNDSIMCMSNSPAKDTLTESEIDAAIGNLPEYDNGELELVDYICKKFGKKKAIVLRSTNLHSAMLELFGGDESHKLMLPVLNPDVVIKAGRYAIALAAKLIEKCKDRDVTIIMNGTDFGGKTGCIESPDIIRRIYLPVQSQFCRNVEKAGKIPSIHCCGCVWDVLKDIVNTGYKIYQSIQATAGMDIAKIKKEFGNQLTLWAGVQCETLVEGTREQVEQEVKRSLAFAMPDGGFIFGSTNSVQYGANTDNYLRAVELVRKYGVYR
jgi:hypothetical protein